MDKKGKLTNAIEGTFYLLTMCNISMAGQKNAILQCSNNKV